MNTHPRCLVSWLLLALLGPHFETPAFGGEGVGGGGLGRVPEDEMVDQSSGGLGSKSGWLVATYR